ncbi:hypothetical protein GDO86_014158 [Hymenochirus boettgeri]|uniref:protein-glutamine gamma-glutamyltransferase n=1 Tax=Hymenochirus boettgeri TaxID=247094 RepID=A0A8T2JQP6_9PIPI|nr:hypothetical protein GDO86_014158 [Hymenochirus boettgeri]
MPVSRYVNPKTWSASRISSIGGTLTISINIPVTAVIGRYKIYAQVNRSGRTVSYNPNELYVLFNPWNSDDEVYMSDEDERSEYVLNETGLIFVGSANSIGSRRWDFAQFEGDMVPITLKLLDQSLDYRKDPATDVSNRNNPIYVGRVLSAMINSNDDNGVLMGNWSGDYSGGQNPGIWNGSSAILRSWNKNGPVKYGQCWVYGGALCTVLRCLGIPARPITNFDSAHDTNTNLLIEQYYDENGRSLPSPDSVWNFHVWVEAWFARNDLGDFYSGWQILDATPQETSSGVYRLGPTSQKAVKEGDVTLDYDGIFVYGEVNSDKKDYIKKSDGQLVNIYTDSTSVGQLISTKAVGSFTRLDITKDYKYPEESTEERDRFTKARNTLLKRGIAAMSLILREKTALKPEITGAFKVDGNPQLGEDVEIFLNLKNPLSINKNVNVKTTGTTIVYNRTIIKEILNKSQSISLAPYEEKSITFTILYSEYGNAITSDNMIQIIAVCDEENGASLLVDAVVTLKNPTLQIQVAEQASVNRSFSVGIIFINILTESATKCSLTFEGSGLLRDPLTVNVPDLKAKEKYETKVSITPYRAGKRNLTVGLTSNKFSDVKAYHMINVNDS